MRMDVIPAACFQGIKFQQSSVVMFTRFNLIPPSQEIPAELIVFVIRH